MRPIYLFKCVSSKEFEDLDEIVARYVQPMASFARDLLNHKYYQDCNGGDKKVSLSWDVGVSLEVQGYYINFFISGQVLNSLCLSEAAAGVCSLVFLLLLGVWLSLSSYSYRRFCLGAVEIGEQREYGVLPEQQRVTLTANVTESNLLSVTC